MDQTSVREIGEQLLKSGEVSPSFYTEKYYWVPLEDTEKFTHSRKGNTSMDKSEIRRLGEQLLNENELHRYSNDWYVLGVGCFADLDNYHSQRNGFPTLEEVTLEWIRLQFKS